MRLWCFKVVPVDYTSDVFPCRNSSGVAWGWCGCRGAWFDHIWSQHKVTADNLKLQPVSLPQEYNYNQSLWHMKTDNTNCIHFFGYQWQCSLGILMVTKRSPASIRLPNFPHTSILGILRFLSCKNKACNTLSKCTDRILPSLYNHTCSCNCNWKVKIRWENYLCSIFWKIYFLCV